MIHPDALKLVPTPIEIGSLKWVRERTIRPGERDQATQRRVRGPGWVLSPTLFRREILG